MNMLFTYVAIFFIMYLLHMCLMFIIDACVFPTYPVGVKVLSLLGEADLFTMQIPHIAIP